MSAQSGKTFKGGSICKIDAGFCRLSPEREEGSAAKWTSPSSIVSVACGESRTRPVCPTC